LHTTYIRALFLTNCVTQPAGTFLSSSSVSLLSVAVARLMIRQSLSLCEKLLANSGNLLILCLKARINDWPLRKIQKGCRRSAGRQSCTGRSVGYFYSFSCSPHHAMKSARSGIQWLAAIWSAEGPVLLGH